MHTSSTVLLNVSKDPVSTIGGAINLAPHLGSSSSTVVASPSTVAAAARAVVSWATSLANQYRALH
jgi:hypothetical protein